MASYTGQAMSRRSWVLALLLLGSLADHAAAQARVGGLVRDEDGQALKGATVVADNRSQGTTTFTATTDERGRFSMIGLRPGQWRFIAQAPAHEPAAIEIPIRAASTANPPITFALRKSGILLGPLGRIAAKDLQSDLSAADALFKQQKWDEAIAAYTKIASRSPALGVVNLQIGAAYRAKKDYDAAIAAYGKLLDADPGNEKATVAIAGAQLDKGDLQAAEATLAKAAESPTAGREVLYALGEVNAAQRRADEAAQWFAKAASADPSWGKPLYQLARLSLDKGDAASAAKYLNDVVAVDPTSAEATQAKAELERLK